MYVKQIGLALVVGFCFSAVARAEVVVSSPQLPLRPGAVGVAYVTLTSDREDVLLSAASACCTAVELHNHIHEGDVMKMRRVENVPLPKGVPVVFESGGLHVMLIGIKQPLVPAQKLPITFTFQHAKPQTVTFVAQPTNVPEHHGQSH